MVRGNRVSSCVPNRFRLGERRFQLAQWGYQLGLELVEPLEVSIPSRAQSIYWQRGDQLAQAAFELEDPRSRCDTCL